ncbi:MAG: DUF1405 domain-containing protein [Candidatus Heimdallarchaeota archaeon]
MKNCFLEFELLSNPAIRYPLAALNVAAGLLLIHTNFWPRQMQDAPIFLWPFIPDCTIAALLVAIALVWPEQRGKLVQLMAALTCLQAGVSFLALILDQPQFYTVIALAAHLGLFLEGLVLMARLNDLQLNQAGGGLTWLVVNNLIDLLTESMAYSAALVSQELIIAVWAVTDLCLAIWTIALVQRSQPVNYPKQKFS